jgi:hypothetical protein
MATNITLQAEGRRVYFVGDTYGVWAEAGWVPGYRICTKCGQHYMAAATCTSRL